MEISEDDYRAQKRLFKALNSELRLKLLRQLTDGPTSAPELAEEFDVVQTTITNNLNELENVGLAVSKTVRGPGGRPRKEFELPEDGIRVELEAVEDEYHFSFETVSVLR